MKQQRMHEAGVVCVCVWVWIILSGAVCKQADRFASTMTKRASKQTVKVSSWTT